MILWLALFALIIAISFILALSSMREYREIPIKSTHEYSLYLIRSPLNLNATLLNSLRSDIAADALFLSLERLFKGQKSALTVFGSKKTLEKFKADLALLELEDYSLNLVAADLTIWEMSAKKLSDLHSVFKNLPSLSPEEQFFWQVVLAPANDGFSSQIRAAVYSKDPTRRKELSDSLQNAAPSGLIKIPRPYSPEQMLSFYRLRQFGKDAQGLMLSPEKIVDLIKIS